MQQKEQQKLDIKAEILPRMQQKEQQELDIRYDQKTLPSWYKMTIQATAATTPLTLGSSSQREAEARNGFFARSQSSLRAFV